MLVEILMKFTDAEYILSPLMHIHLNPFVQSSLSKDLLDVYCVFSAVLSMIREHCMQGKQHNKSDTDSGLESLHEKSDVCKG